MSIIHYLFSFSLQHSDMNEEMRVEAMELCVTACEKHASSNEVIIIITVSALLVCVHAADWPK